MFGKKNDGAYAHVQTWTVNYNAEFLHAFSVNKETNPDLEHFHQAAVDNFRRVAVDLFGEEGKDIPVRYVEKQTTNRKPIFVGKTAQFQAFLSSPGVLENLDITSVKDTVVTVRTSKQKDNSETPTCCLPPIFGCGTIEVKLSEDPDVDQVL